MVHRPGMTDHDFDHLPDRSFPIAALPEFIRLHEQVAGLVAPSKVVAVAVNTSLYADEADARRVIAETADRDRAADRRPVRFGGAPAVRRDPRRALEPRRMTLAPATHEVAPDPVPRPVPDRPDRRIERDRRRRRR